VAALPTSPTKFRNKLKTLQVTNDGSSPAKRALLARAIQVECFERHQWVEKVSPDGVKVWVAQLRPRYRYGG
jgi:hypothetical protein